MIPTIVCAVFVAALVAAEYFKSVPARMVTKPIASVAFLATAWVNGAMDTAYGRTVLVALVCCAIGDVLLMFVHNAMFLGGLGSFLVGHLVLAYAFVKYGTALQPLAVSLAVLALIGGRVLLWLMPHVDKPMKLPVLFYSAAISVMVAASMSAFGAGAHWLVPLGALLFYVSDLMVAREKFVQPHLINAAIGLPIYYASTLLFAWSIALVR
jgi:uncharacterized membrane protein YhhN